MTFPLPPSHGAEWMGIQNIPQSRVIDITDFGADSYARFPLKTTSAIQKAYRICMLMGGGTVFFPPGTFMFNPISIPGASVTRDYINNKVHFQFSGKGVTILTPAQPNQPLFNVTGNAAATQFLGGFTVQAHPQGSTGPAIDLSGARQFVIDSASYWDSAKGVGGGGTYAQVIGFGINSYANLISNPLCEGQSLGQSFIGSINNATVVANNNTITNPLFESNTAPFMIDAAGTSQLNISSGIIEGNSGVAIRLGNTTRVKNVHLEANLAAYAMNGAGVDSTNPGTCWLENNVYNTGAGTLTIPAGVATQTTLIGPLGSLTVVDNTSSYINNIAGRMVQGWSLWSAPQRFGAFLINGSGAITPSMINGSYQRITGTTGTVSILNAAGNQGDGQLLIIEVVQPATPISVIFSGQYLLNSTFTPSTAPGSSDILGFIWNGTRARWLEIFRHTG